VPSVPRVILCGSLSHGNRSRECLLRDIEHFDPVVAGIGDVDFVPLRIEQHVLQASAPLGLGGQRVNDAALVGLPVIHIHADHVRQVMASFDASVTLNGRAAGGAGVGSRCWSPPAG